jgi:uncharacterized protein YndB with AHSA1/START domain
MKRFIAAIAVLAAVALAAGTSPVLAHGPTRQKITETVDIDRPPAEVWALVKDFDSISKWHPLIASSPADHGNDEGSVRTLTLRAPGDPKITEEILTYDDKGMTYHYKIDSNDVKVLPVNNYTSWFTVMSNGHGGTTVEWRGAFYRGYMLNDPPEALNDEAAVKAVTAVYRAGLDNLKKLAEAKS